MTAKKDSEALNFQPDPDDLHFAIVPEGLLDDIAISHGAVRLYGILNRYANAKGTLWVKRETLAARMGCGTSSVDRWRLELMEKGWVTAERKFRDGRQVENSYMVRRSPRPPKQLPELAPGAVRVTTSGEPGYPYAGTLGSPPAGNRIRALESEPINESPRAIPLNPAEKQGLPLPPRADTEGGPSETARGGSAPFDGFWEAYPKRRGVTRGPKNRAQEAWRKLSGEDQRRATVGAGHYAVAQDPEFVRDAVRFLRDRTFDDYQEARARRSSATRAPVPAKRSEGGPLVVEELKL